MPWILTSATVRAMFMVLSSSLFIMRCINIQRPELACGIPVSLYYYSSAGILIGNTGTTNNSRRRLFSATTNNPRAGILRVVRRGGGGGGGGGGDEGQDQVRFCGLKTCPGIM